MEPNPKILSHAKIYERDYATPKYKHVHFTHLYHTSNESVNILLLCWCCVHSLVLTPCFPKRQGNAYVSSIAILNQCNVVKKCTIWPYSINPIGQVAGYWYLQMMLAYKDHIASIYQHCSVGTDSSWAGFLRAQAPSCTFDWYNLGMRQQ
jgi:hypothetical protein